MIKVTLKDGSFLELEAGKSAYDEILYYNDPLQAAGIGEVTEAEFTFHMFDSDTWLADYDSQPVRVVK